MCSHPQEREEAKIHSNKTSFNWTSSQWPPSHAATLRYSKNLFGLSVSRALLPSLSASDSPAHFYTLLLLLSQTQSLSPFFFFKCASFRSRRRRFFPGYLQFILCVRAMLLHLLVRGSQFISWTQRIFKNPEIARLSTLSPKPALCSSIWSSNPI